MIIRKENIMGLPRFESLDDKFWRYIDIYDVSFVYVLLVNDVNIYVGSTVDLERRLKAHIKKTASCHTKYHKTLKLLELYMIPEKTFHVLEIFETLITIKYANGEKYEDIRGGIYISRKLYNTKEFIRKQKFACINHFNYPIEKLNQMVEIEKCKVDITNLKFEHPSLQTL
jgi:hypothetical protein